MCNWAMKILDSCEIILDIIKSEAVPILEEFKKWIDYTVEQVPPTSLLGKAINYTLNEWQRLIRYTEDGHMSPDNNTVENAIRPFVIGRKNWLFSDTPKGAKACLKILLFNLLIFFLLSFKWGLLSAYP